MPRIEFRENGIFDSLTGAPTFRFFRSQLEREIALRKRSTEPLSIVTIFVSRPVDDGEVFMLNQGILRVSRNEDFYCRASENGFWICLRSDALGATKASDRILKSCTHIFEQISEYGIIEKNDFKIPYIHSEIHEYHGGISLEKFIEQIDKKFFAL